MNEIKTGNILVDAIRDTEQDIKIYTRRGDFYRLEMAEYLNRVLNKQRIDPVLKEYYKENHCYDCGSDNQIGSYCSNCGKRLK